MGRNSKARRDRKKKARKPATLKSNTYSPMSLDYHQAMRELDRLIDPSKLTVPTEINEDIEKFCETISEVEPFFIDIEPEPWCRQSSCNLNVREYIRLHGGTMICGYKIWYHQPQYIEAERHAIWFKDGEYKDISFNADGENTILFLPDVPEKQGALDLNEARFRWGKDARTRQLIEILEQNERSVLRQQMDDHTAWRVMLTYEDWLKGKRMPSFIPVVL
jgi:hypothetical protein